MFARRLTDVHCHLLKPATSLQITARWKVQTPVSKTPPRRHIRRIFDAVVEPILPDDPKFVGEKPPALRCTRPAVDEAKQKRSAELSLRDLAMRDYLRQHLSEAVVVVVCHEHPTDARSQHYELMEMSANGVAFSRLQEAKVMRSLLRGTTLDPLTVFFEDDVSTLTSLMFTKRYTPEEDDGRFDIVSGKVRDRNYLPVTLSYAKRTPWIVPLAVVYKNRMMTVREAEEVVSMLQSPLRVRGETVAILNSPIAETSRLLNEHPIGLTTALKSRTTQLEKQGSTDPKDE